MSDPAARTFSSDFKRFFVRGLVILLPSMVTLWIVVTAYQFIDSKIAQPINNGILAGLRRISPSWSPAQSIHDFWVNNWFMHLIGLAVAIIAVYITGYLLGGYLGRGAYRHIERLITSLPIFKQVYPYVKQIVDFLFSDKKGVKFNAVVIVEYPRKGIWSIGFQTGKSLQSIHHTAGDSVAIFIPSSPTPFTGYTITVPRKDVIELPISVEEAIRFVVSGGVLVPEREQLAGDQKLKDQSVEATRATAHALAAAQAQSATSSSTPSTSTSSSSVAVQEKACE